MSSEKIYKKAKYGNESVDTARKKAYNNKQDSKQFARYQEVLKELCPKNLSDFQKIKYDNPKRWNKLKYQYRTVNQYKIDSGNLSVQEILDFDEIVISEKRGNFTSKYKKSGNNILMETLKIYIWHTVKLATKKKQTNIKAMQQ